MTAQDLGFIVHNVNTGSMNTPADPHLAVSTYNEIWIISGDPTVYLTQSTAQQLLNANFLSHYYPYDEHMYAPSTRSIVENLVSDPYSIDLTLNGIRSRLTES